MSTIRKALKAARANLHHTCGETNRKPCRGCSVAGTIDAALILLDVLDTEIERLQKIEQLASNVIEKHRLSTGATNSAATLIAMRDLDDALTATTTASEGGGG